MKDISEDMAREEKSEAAMEFGLVTVKGVGKRLNIYEVDEQTPLSNGSSLAKVNAIKDDVLFR